MCVFQAKFETGEINDLAYPYAVLAVQFIPKHKKDKG